MKRDINILFMLLCCWIVASPLVQAANCPPPLQTPSAEVLQQMKQSAADRGFLWQIAKGNHVSWLYGTMHVGKQDWFIPGPQVMSALQRSDTVALEMDPADPDVQQKMNVLMQTGAGQIPKNLKPELKKLMDEVCFPGQAMDMMHPVFLLTTIELLSLRTEGLEASYGVEQILSPLAHQLNKKIIALETPESQVHTLLGDHPDIIDTQELSEAIDYLASRKSQQQTLRMVDDWANSNLDDMEQFESWCDCLNTDAQREEMHRLLDDRNPAMADAVDALHAQGNAVFVAVGSLHMVGKIGLPALLKAKGYSVTRMPFTKIPAVVTTPAAGL